MSQDALKYHADLKGKIEVISRVKIETREDLALAYTPGVAEPCKEIALHPEKVYEYTRKGNMVAVITDGSAVLGLGNIGPEAGLPVMEGKCILFKEFAGVDAFPIALKTQDVDEFVRTVELISPMFGGINLEDISAPRCFEIERKLRERLDIPVFHDDQHGTAIVVLAGLLNAIPLAGKNLTDVQIVINGAGAAGTAIAELLHAAGAKNIRVLDSLGIISLKRSDLNEEKKLLAGFTNSEQKEGTLGDALIAADVFIGVSKAGLLTAAMIRTMNEKAIIFAMANPTPEIFPDKAKEAGAFIVATGRSDFPNQVNNVLAFPGIFRGLLDARIKTMNNKMYIAAARAIASVVTNPNGENILPSPFEKTVSLAVAEAVKFVGKN
ncbi:MAG: malate dehydrogenase [Candidatus Magasanikbacteria bacterium RIFCSPHIGHO2_02_FULL_41_13]|uniref:Malate dehydrogenase n=1 Tax=Candidatus Magasanikbacteria bacterium RIFCSPHIGHO2_02_FULL_41_13 TaxID=1798676 RepID=A0A1F6M2T1_9BACT|nr:MAG: malate dehydrogenase [Candidatus Magasanikbacteria bacterium RIFCSPHIGHO2_02_FULL_41_13]